VSEGESQRQGKLKTLRVTQRGQEEGQSAQVGGGMSQRRTKLHRDGEVEPQRKIQRSAQKQAWRLESKHSRQDRNDPLLLCSGLVCKKY